MIKKIIATIKPILLMCVSISAPCISMLRPLIEGEDSDSRVIEVSFKGVGERISSVYGQDVFEIPISHHMHDTEYARLVNQLAASLAGPGMLAVALDGKESRLTIPQEDTKEYTMLKHPAMISISHNRINFNEIKRFHGMLNFVWDNFDHGLYDGGLRIMRSERGAYLAVIILHIMVTNIIKLQEISLAAYSLALKLDSMPNNEQIVTTMEDFLREHGANIREGKMSYRNPEGIRIEVELSDEVWRPLFFGA